MFQRATSLLETRIELESGLQMSERSLPLMEREEAQGLLRTASSWSRAGSATATSPVPKFRYSSGRFERGSTGPEAIRSTTYRSATYWWRWSD
jgi:hypothetical protein